MTERLPRLSPDRLTSEQARVYRAIAGGPRGSGPQLFQLADAEGALNGPFGIMLHQPALGLALQELGSAVRYRTELSDRCREIAILQVGVAEESDFEWYAHEAVGRSVGITDEELVALSEQRFHSTDEVEEAVVRFTQHLLAGTAIAQDDYERFEQRLGVAALVELTVLVGYYRTLAAMMRVFEVGRPVDDDSAVARPPGRDGK